MNNKLILTVLLFFSMPFVLFAQEKKPIEYKEGDQMVIQFGAKWCPSCTKLKTKIKLNNWEGFLKNNIKVWTFLDIDSLNIQDILWVQKAQPFRIYPTIVKYERRKEKWVEINRFEGNQSIDFIKLWLEMDRKKAKKVLWL